MHFVLNWEQNLSKNFLDRKCKGFQRHPKYEPLFVRFLMFQVFGFRSPLYKFFDRIAIFLTSLLLIRYLTSLPRSTARVWLSKSGGLSPRTLKEKNGYDQFHWDWCFRIKLICNCLQRGSEIRTCLDFEWSIFVRFSNGPYFGWFI